MTDGDGTPLMERTHDQQLIERLVKYGVKVYRIAARLGMSDQTLGRVRRGERELSTDEQADLKSMADQFLGGDS